MQLLITSASTKLARRLAASLSANHEIRLTDIVDVQTDFDFIRSNLDHESQLPVQHVDSVVHLARPPSANGLTLNDISDSANQLLDFSTRCTYNLLTASAEAGVSNFIFLSTLRLFDRLGPNVAIGPRWRPQPSTAPDLLASYLGECICKEFARERLIKITILRLGEVSTEEISTAVSDAIDDKYWKIIHLGD
ncbi:hypothetical protein CMK19_08805 [Candidatus Poribacteria bacterium]|mgnify:FL=1|nr:hypothetical protein [Candidatus Poribacteria bacterium]MEE2911949.1 NAD(P)-dependent oxidoreductase [Candidatus Poribacteria bacterium]|tara:strand:+ start:1646 stop:2224 length:579 start_codon:yes stop_codon:yes gene_type:complete